MAIKMLHTAYLHASKGGKTPSPHHLISLVGCRECHSSPQSSQSQAVKKDIFEKGKSPSPSIPKHSACGKRPDPAVPIRAVRKNTRIRSVYTCLFEALHSARASVPEARSPFVHGSVSQPTVASSSATRTLSDGGKDHSHESVSQPTMAVQDTEPCAVSEKPV